MNDIDFLYIGWVKEVNNNVHSDKVWTAFTVGGKYYAGWGARGKTLNFKLHDNKFSLINLINKKSKTYVEVDALQLFTLFSTFKEDVEKRLLVCLLTDNIIS